MNKDLKHYKSDVDIDEIWNAIEPAVDSINAEREDKKKPAFLFWWGGILLVIVGLIGGYFVFNQQGDAPVSADDNSVNIVEETDLNSEANNHLINSNITIDATENIVNNSIKVGEDDGLLRDVRIDDRVVSGRDVQTSGLNKRKPGRDGQASSLSQREPGRDGQASGLNKRVAVNKVSKNILKPLPNTEFSLLESDDYLPFLSFPITEENSRAGSFGSAYDKPSISLEFQVGISKPNRSLKSGVDGGLDTLLGLRNRDERTLEGLHANLFVSTNLQSGFFIKTGVSYTQFTELYSNFNTVETTVIQEGVQKRVINLNGDTTDVIGPIEVIQTTTFRKKYYNTYRMIDIPVIVGYQHKYNEDWSTDFSLGVFTNLVFKSKGKIPSSPTTDLDLSEANIFKPRFGYSVHFGLGISRQLSENLSLRLNPNFRYYPKNMMQERYGLEQRYVLFGVNLGLKMDL